MWDKKAPGPIDVYKVHHHGSNDSSSTRLLEQMTPEFALIPVAAGNPYGHPHGETMGRLEDVQATVLRTDLHGDVVVHCDGRLALRLISDAPNP